MPERLAGVNIGKVNLNKGDIYPGERVAYRDARVGVSGGIDNNEIRLLLTCLLDAIDDLSLMVALMTTNGYSRICGRLYQSSVDIA